MVRLSSTDKVIEHRKSPLFAKTYGRGPLLFKNLGTVDLQKGRLIWCSLHRKAGTEGCNLHGFPRRTNELARRSSGRSCSVISHGCGATGAAQLPLSAHAAGQHDVEASLGLETAAIEVRCKLREILFILVGLLA